MFKVIIEHNVYLFIGKLPYYLSTGNFTHGTSDTWQWFLCMINSALHCLCSVILTVFQTFKALNILKKTFLEYYYHLHWLIVTIMSIWLFFKGFTKRRQNKKYLIIYNTVCRTVRYAVWVGNYLFRLLIFS